MAADIDRKKKTLAVPPDRPQVRYMSRARRGLTLVELVVVIAILAVLGVVIVSTTGGSSAALQNDQERVNKVATELDIISRALAFFEPTKTAFSFKQTVGVYPGRLSHLTTAITTSMQNSCGASYTAAQATIGLGGYYTRELPTTGFFMAPGFKLQDALIRSPANTSTRLDATLAIVIPDVTLSDAQLLDQTVDRDLDGLQGTVRYTPSGDLPVAVSYLTAIGRC